MDDKSKVGNPDRDRININEDYEVQYWSKKLDVTAEELKDAVKAAGSTADAVEKYLNK